MATKTSKPEAPVMSAEEIELRALGKAGKLWRIVVMYNDGPGIGQHSLTNQTGAQVFKFRENIFAIGLMLAVSPGEWLVIHPMDIKEIRLFKQSNFF